MKGPVQGRRGGDQPFHAPPLSRRTSNHVRPRPPTRAGIPRRPSPSPSDSAPSPEGRVSRPDLGTSSRAPPNPDPASPPHRGPRPSPLWPRLLSPKKTPPVARPASESRRLSPGVSSGPGQSGFLYLGQRPALPGRRGRCGTQAVVSPASASSKEAQRRSQKYSFWPRRCRLIT